MSDGAYDASTDKNKIRFLIKDSIKSRIFAGCKSMTIWMAKLNEALAIKGSLVLAIKK